jgi:uncharacterized protein YcbX
MKSVGSIKELMRYPIKSFAGEALLEAEVAHYGLAGDRMHTFIDESKEGFARYFTARQIPEMLLYKAEWLGENVQVTALDGTIFQWDDRLLAEMQQYSRREMSRLTCRPETEELMAVDCESISLITDASLKQMEKLWGKALDRRRFRANLIIGLAEDTPFIETEWVGKRLQIGDAVIQLNVECERCTVVTLDPDDIEKDASLLKKIITERKQNFGIYASVVQMGSIRQGDVVHLL